MRLKESPGGTRGKQRAATGTKDTCHGDAALKILSKNQLGTPSENRMGSEIHLKLMNSKYEANCVHLGIRTTSTCKSNMKSIRKGTANLDRGLSAGNSLGEK